MSWKQSTTAKRDHVLSLIPQEWRFAPGEIGGRTKQPNVIDLLANHISANELEITTLPISQLLQLLTHGTLTAGEALAAFAHRAALAHQLTHCLSEFHYQHAKQRAALLDEHWRVHQKPLGPLHGLPVSLMDRFDVAGLESACGFASWLGHVKKEEDEGVLVKQLRSLGAIIFCKTNVPMSSMMGETDNNIMGFTMNPYNRTLSAGGACGGEGALIALRGSPIGFGTDIAGSTRIPAVFNNLYSLKCSEQRLPQDGITKIVGFALCSLDDGYVLTITKLPGLPTAAGSIGMLSHDLEGVKVVFKSILDSCPWTYDMDILELPWRSEKYESIHVRSCNRTGTKANGRLVFGLMICDEHVNPHLPIQLALKKVHKALVECGYEVIEWKPPPQNVAVENLVGFGPSQATLENDSADERQFKIFGSTGAQEIRRAIDASGEPPVAQMRPWYEQHSGENILTSEFWNLCEARDQYRRDYGAYWRHMDNQTTSGRRVDGVVQPVAPYLAGRQNDFQYYTYSAIANVLDIPAASFPVSPGFSRADLSGEGNKCSASSEADSKVRDNYRTLDASNMPVGLQVLGHRLQEEKVLAMAQAITEALQRLDRP